MRPRAQGLALLGLSLLLWSRAHALEIIVGLPYGKHRIGHTAVRVRAPEGKGEVIYDFGRYGKTWGYLHFQGEGILRVWRGPKQVARYLRKQTSYRDSVGFTIRVSPEEEEKVFGYYEGLLQTARWSKAGDRHTRYRLRRDYDGYAWQCTSVALAGVKAVLPRGRWATLLDTRFNRGVGFNRQQREHYFRSQKKAGLDETVVPLDLLLALSFAQWAGHPDVLRVVTYPRRVTRRGARKGTGSTPRSPAGPSPGSAR